MTEARVSSHSGTYSALNQLDGFGLFARQEIGRNMFGFLWGF
jgi:hypothetical protein